jgi:ElaB/YqjD/DUF883 family membrane-anchored ribosome-binding protein
MNSDETKAKTNAEELIKSTARNVSELANIATHQLGESVHRGKAKLTEMQALLTDKTKEYARQTDHYVQENPWRAVGIAAGAGLIIGLLIRRR